MCVRVFGHARSSNVNKRTSQLFPTKLSTVHKGRCRSKNKNKDVLTELFPIKHNPIKFLSHSDRISVCKHSPHQQVLPRDTTAGDVEGLVRSVYVGNVPRLQTTRYPPAMSYLADCHPSPKPTQCAVRLFCVNEAMDARRARRGVSRAGQSTGTCVISRLSWAWRSLFARWCKAGAAVCRQSVSRADWRALARASLEGFAEQHNGLRERETSDERDWRTDWKINWIRTHTHNAT